MCYIYRLDIEVVFVLMQMQELYTSKVYEIFLSFLTQLDNYQSVNQFMLLLFG